jgi:hypothetical protein
MTVDPEEDWEQQLASSAMMAAMRCGSISAPSPQSQGCGLTALPNTSPSTVRTASICRETLSTWATLTRGHLQLARARSESRHSSAVQTVHG